MSDDNDSPYSMAEYAAKWLEVKRRSDRLVGLSLADRLALCEAAEPGTTSRLLEEVGPLGWTMTAYDWQFWGRPKQLAPLAEDDDWRICLFIAGRGAGKTALASQWVLERIMRGAREVVFAGPTMDDVKTYMVGGYKRRVDGGNGSGFLDVLPPWIRYNYREDDGVIELPDQHCIVHLHSGEVPEFRGPNPDTVWGDEVIKWRYGSRLLSNLRLACRSVGVVSPRLLLTTSPKRYKLLRDLVMEPSVLTIHAKTDENVGNVDKRWFDDERRRLSGTRQGREELDGELEGDDDADLFPMGAIERGRVEASPKLDRIVVAIDPAGTVNRRSDLTGIVAAGRSGSVRDGHGYVIADKTSRYTWEAWGEAAIKLAEEVGASAIVMENNKFSDSVIANLRMAGQRRGYAAQPRPGFKHLQDLVGNTGRRIQMIEVNARGDKASRAGPVSTLYGGLDADKPPRVHHVGVFADLETEMSEFTPDGGRSPNRMDALVYAITELFELDRPPSHDRSAAFSGLRRSVEEAAAPAAHRGTSRAEGMASLLGSLTRGTWGSRL